MKILHRIILASLSLLIVLSMSGCEHDVAIGSTVYEDGSLDRTIVLYKADSDKISGNIMGASEAGGWKTNIEQQPGSGDKKNKDNKVTITFTKHFASVEDVNREMSRPDDTLFQVRSSFEKENRWFYTYIEYKDTYLALDRFKAIPHESYFTREDYAFIDRLPAEGKPVSKADSLYLARLNEKIFDLYGARTIYEEMFSDMLATMREYNVPANWTDTLLHKKETIYQRFVKEDNMEDDELLAVADALKIPLPEAAREAVRKRSTQLKRRLDFVSEAYSAKFLHTIRMPWKVMATNADSVSGNALFWNPPVIKFLLKDYTMTARARTMNIWAVIISGIVVLVSFALFFFRRRTAQLSNAA